ncbi:hypothetical protein ACVFYP_25390 [Roseomonas sp. F4]|nr:hypothetical protein [Roseomonas oleicola]
MNETMMSGGMFWGMGVVGLLFLALLVLAILALAKYVFGRRN